MTREFKSLARKLLDRLRAMSLDRESYSLDFRCHAYVLYNLLSDFALEVIELSRINKESEVKNE